MRATAGNIAADYAQGYTDVVAGFMRGRPTWRAFHDSLKSASRPELEELAASRRSESLAFLVLMMTGVCNADCGVCFTDRKRKPQELTADERDDLLAQAAALGAQYVYVPGEGEPTLDKGWWRFLATCRELDLPAVVFTNGMIFGDEDLCRRTWGMTTQEAARKLAEYPVYLYSKYWTPDSALAARLLGVPERRHQYGQVDGVPVPLGLQTLMEYVPRDRVGIEICVERRNADSVLETLVPFARKHGLAQLVEMMQHNGRTFGDPSYDMTDAQADAVAPLLSATSCTLGTCKAVVTVQGYLSPRIAVLESQLPEDRRRVVGQDFYRLLHETPYIVERRYNLSCLCETIPAELAGEKVDLREVYNVTPPALARVTAVELEPQGGGVALKIQQEADPGGCGVKGGCSACSALCSQH
jgi:hypothetical protein